MKSLLILVTILYTTKTSYSSCYWNENCHYKYFSSKTPYEFVRGDIRDSVVIKPGCKTISLWGLVRHGKRNPGENFVYKMLDATILKDYIKTSHDKGNGSMCAQDVENLYNWIIDEDTFRNVHQIAKEGYEEMAGLGHRFSAVFKDLLINADENNYTLRSAYGHWLENSVKGFIKGIGNESLIVDKSNKSFDIMAPYESCNYYMKDVKQNPDIYREPTKYQDMNEFLAVKDRIQQRTGINYTLTNENITSLYDLCRYTSSGTHKKFSPWCALFSTEDIKVMEYIGDLRHYYRNSYGTPVNKIFGRIPLSDLLETFINTKNGKGKQFTIYFTHATMMDMVYTALGLFRDEVPLTAEFRNDARKWRSSKSTAFASNLMVTLNRCTDGEETDYNVVFYLNERPLESICNNGECSWREFEEKLKPFVNTTLDFC
ncbi:multiple inositol polyphosphate phosphatase 1-like isoform X3 [Papilio machaon]|uniref:multiple inositol polyphosphate phosphatase 1-like isoform X3 n=1 Tax=Papilio machaon TaxID=76193 RepID=UPI001E665C41|nr:multiple inositol polyphosphate phosphatase 1-like isoform X3 [Papilio machaon]